MTLKALRKILFEAFKGAGLIVIEPGRCGGEPTIGDSRFRFSDLWAFIEERFEPKGSSK